MACTRGMRVEPPTSTISSILLISSPASLIASRHGFLSRSNNASHSDSNFDLLNVSCRCLGPSFVAVMNGRLIVVSWEFDSSTLAFSAASLSRCMAIGSPDRSTPSLLRNCNTKWLISTWSQSSPPRCVSPLVLRTSNTPSPTSRIDTSNVPPPRSNTAIFSLTLRSMPYASAAAVGSLMIRLTVRPAISPASLVACRCASLKYAGTVMTASVTGSPR